MAAMKASPAPVVSTGLTLKAGALIVSLPQIKIEPFSPSFIAVNVVLSLRRSTAASTVLVFVIVTASSKLGQKTSLDARRCWNSWGFDWMRLYAPGSNTTFTLWCLAISTAFNMAFS